MQVVCSIDVGTTRTKAALVDERGVIAAFQDIATPGAAAGDPDHTPDAEGLSSLVLGLLSTLIDRAPVGAAVEGICVTGQRATFTARDAGGRVLASLSWRDSRAAKDVTSLARELDPDLYQATTGLPLSPISVLCRMHWLRRSRPEIAQATRRISLVADTVLEALGAPEGFMDPSNASATGLWDLGEGAWSKALLGLVGLKAEQLPRVVPPGTLVGGLGQDAARATGLRAGTPLLVGGGDQPLASLGMGVLEPGRMGLGLGTSADLTTPVLGVADPLPGRICTAHVLSGYSLLEGFVPCFGAALDWGRALLREEEPAEGLSLGEPRDDDPLFLPFLNGIATPDFVPGVRGGLVGLAPWHGPAVVARAIREGLALEICRILDSSAMPGRVDTLTACGAAVRDSALMAQIANTAGITILAHGTLEATLLGAAHLAWFGLGRFSSPRDAATAMMPESSVRYHPCPRCTASNGRQEAYGRWVTRLLEERW